MSCADWAEILSAMIDGEATSEERGRVDGHVASCTECAARMASLRALKHVVGRLEGRTRPPEPIVARVSSLRFHLTPRARHWRTLGLGAASAAAATIAVLLVARMDPGSTSASRLAAHLVADHLRYRPDVMPAEIASTDAGAVRSFFHGKVPFDPVVPKFRHAALLGGRLCKIEGRKVQLLFYERGSESFSLYISDGPIGMTGCRTSGAHSVCVARRGPLSFTLVGDVSQDVLVTLLDQVVSG